MLGSEHNDEFYMGEDGRVRLDDDLLTAWMAGWVWQHYDTLFMQLSLLTASPLGSLADMRVCTAMHLHGLLFTAARDTVSFPLH